MNRMALMFDHQHWIECNKRRCSCSTVEFIIKLIWPLATQLSKKKWKTRNNSSNCPETDWNNWNKLNGEMWNAHAQRPQHTKSHLSLCIDNCCDGAAVLHYKTGGSKTTAFMSGTQTHTATHNEVRIFAMTKRHPLYQSHSIPPSNWMACVESVKNMYLPQGKTSERTNNVCTFVYAYLLSIITTHTAIRILYDYVFFRFIFAFANIFFCFFTLLSDGSFSIFNLRNAYTHQLANEQTAIGARTGDDQIKHINVNLAGGCPEAGTSAPHMKKCNVSIRFAY